MNNSDEEIMASPWSLWARGSARVTVGTAGVKFKNMQAFCLQGTGVAFSLVDSR